ncbi:MAG: hypothetical protein KAT65_22090 [Methanophagales archaeon]|jgi:hypothetical protein|nr:hypothetical protein [Methanophagales archaeon]
MYMDVDLSTSTLYLKPLLDAIREEHYAIATGSRMLKESRTDRSRKRRMMCLFFNLLVRLMLRSSIRDHQCGFKAFLKDALMSILDEIRDERWLCDTELLVRAQWMGYRIKEILVVWEDKSGAYTKVRTLHDSATMLLMIAELYFALKSGRRKKD